MKIALLFALLVSSVLAQSSTVVRRTTTTTEKDGVVTTTVVEEIRPVQRQIIVQEVGPDRARPEDYYGYVSPCNDPVVYYPQEMRYPAPPVVIYQRDRMGQVTDVLSLVAFGVILNSALHGQCGHVIHRR